MHLSPFLLDGIRFLYRQLSCFNQAALTKTRALTKPSATLRVGLMFLRFVVSDSRSQGIGSRVRSIAQWNLACFAKTLLPLLDEDISRATDLADVTIERYSTVFNDSWISGMRRKLGLFGEEADDLPLMQSLLEWMQKTDADYTITFRDLITKTLPIGETYQSQTFRDWHTRWQARLGPKETPLTFFHYTAKVG